MRQEIQDYMTSNQKLTSDSHLNDHPGHNAEVLHDLGINDLNTNMQDSHDINAVGNKMKHERRVLRDLELKSKRCEDELAASKLQVTKYRLELKNLQSDYRKYAFTCKCQ